MKPRVVLIGSSWHARVIIEILEERNELELVGCTSIDSTQSEVLGYPILGNDAVLPQLLASGVHLAFVAIGHNETREAVARRIEELGLELINAISGRAILSPRAVVGRGVAIMPGAVVNTGVIIGDGVVVNTGATIDHDCSIGRYAHIGPGANLAGSVRIGDGALLGVGSSVVPGIRIGLWVTVGAGAAVIRDLPDYVTAAGVPAIPVSSRTGHRRY
ncbi:MAG: acetyltransferase [Bryobacteraceae bacterium]|jgi:UDP-perosamine 4-acetyltransferase